MECSLFGSTVDPAAHHLLPYVGALQHRGFLFPEGGRALSPHAALFPLSWMENVLFSSSRGFLLLLDSPQRSLS